MMPENTPAWVCTYILYSTIIGWEKILVKSSSWRNGGKYLVNFNWNKTICTYIINIALGAPEKIQCLKWSAQRGAQLNFYMCVIKCIVVSMFEFTVNKATTSSYKDVWKVKVRGRLVITVILMPAITKSIASS